MQGDQAETSIINALDKIYKHLELFDVVVIIRGGGATTDLACFDSYNLALNSAQFPLPIIAGIGHQRDFSILDMIAHTSVKTPTAAAEFLIEVMQNAESELYTIADEIHLKTSWFIKENLQQLDMMKLQIRQAARSGLIKEKYQIDKKVNDIRRIFRQRIYTQESKLELLKNKIEIHSPKYLFERGYSITTLNGKRLNSKTQVKIGDKIRTYLADGNFESEVQ